MKTRPKLLRIAVINCHMTTVLRGGVLKWMLRRHPWTNIIMLQEIGSGAELRKYLPKGWEAFPVTLSGANQSGTYVCWKTERFDLYDWVVQNISFKGPHNRWMVSVHLMDKKTGRNIEASSVHCQPLGEGLVKSPAPARGLQTKQLEVYRDNFLDVPAGTVKLAGGDFNQSLANRVPRPLWKHSAHKIFGDAGMVAASSQVDNPGELKLMELFVSKEVEVKTRRTYFPKSVPGLDHEIVFVKVAYRQ